MIRKNATKPKPRRKVLSDTPQPRKLGQYDTISKIPPRPSEVFTTRLETVTSTLVTASASSYVNPGYFFSLGDIDNASAFTGLFDQYRIDAVEFSVLPMQNAIGLTTNSVTTTVPLYCVVDYDDANGLTTASVARGFDTCIVVPPGQACTRTFQPRSAVAAYAGTFTSYQNVASQWIDANSPGVQHYGAKLYIPMATAAQTQLQSWQITRTYWISFRKVHG